MPDHVVLLERVIVPETAKTLRMYAHLPYEGVSNRFWLKEVLGPRARLQPVQRAGKTVWKVSPHHLLPLAAAMADKYGHLELRMEISQTERCDRNCQNAKYWTVHRCVCECAGEHHGGRGQHSDWYPAGRTTLRRTETTEITQAFISRGQIQLPPPSDDPLEDDGPEDDGLDDDETPAAEAPDNVVPLTRPTPTPPGQPAPAPDWTTAAPSLGRGGEPQPVWPPEDLGSSRATIPRTDYYTPPQLRTPVAPPRRGIGGGLWVVAAVVIAALGLVVWSMTRPHHHAPPTTHPVPAPLHVVVPQPQPVPPHLPAPPSRRPVAPSAAPPQSGGGGCYPFQSNC